jgi:hypothetical protein
VVIVEDGAPLFEAFVGSEDCASSHNSCPRTG